MSQYCISYDLHHKPSSNYSKIYKTLGKYDHQRLQKSMWLLNTAKTTDEIMQDFRHCVDLNDHFVVFPIDQNLLNFLKE